MKYRLLAGTLFILLLSACQHRVGIPTQGMVTMSSLPAAGYVAPAPSTIANQTNADAATEQKTNGSDNASRDSSQNKVNDQAKTTDNNQQTMDQ